MAPFRASALLFAALAVLSLSYVRAGVPGGLEQADVGDAGVKSAAAFAVGSLNKGCDHCDALQMAKNGDLVVKEVVKASTQVVAGINYHLTLLVVDSAGKEYEVSTTVWSRPWLAAKNDLKNPAMQVTQCSHKEGVSA